MDQNIQYEAEKIIIEVSPVSAATRLIVGVPSLAGLLLSLRGFLQIAEALLHFLPFTENNLYGILVTIVMFILSIAGILWAVDAGKVLTLDPKTNEGQLIKRYLFKTVKKRFPFQSLSPSFVEQDVDLNNVWYVTLKLPDKTRIGVLSSKKTSEMWRDRINAMIAET